jgi:trehalose-phosphatase
MSRWLFDDTARVGARIRRAPHLLVCLDLDGTLIPIVHDPAVARLSPSMQQGLSTLGSCQQVSLAILSGRERADLQARVDLPGLIYAGNHGLEISGPGWLFVERTAAEHCQAIQALAADLSKKLEHVPGTLVEDKGLTLSVHYRQVATADVEEVQLVHSALAGSSYPFHLTASDMVFEISPRVEWNKGDAVGWIKEQVGKPGALVLYVGDDITDEEAFAAFPENITIKVGGAAETRAHYRVEDLTEVQRFLEWLTNRVYALAATAS